MKIPTSKSFVSSYHRFLSVVLFALIYIYLIIGIQKPDYHFNCCTCDKLSTTMCSNERKLIVDSSFISLVGASVQLKHTNSSAKYSYAVPLATTLTFHFLFVSSFYFIGAKLVFYMYIQLNDDFVYRQIHFICRSLFLQTVALCDF